jgi:transposase
MGLLLDCEVTPASEQDANVAAKVLERVMRKYPTIEIVYVDSAYQRHSFLDETDKFNLEVNTPTEIVKTCKTGFKVVAKRWVIERTNAWSVRWRALFRDVERLYSSSKAWILLSMIHLMIRRLA